MTCSNDLFKWLVLMTFVQMTCSNDICSNDICSNDFCSNDFCSNDFCSNDCFQMSFCFGNFGCCDLLSSDICMGNFYLNFFSQCCICCNDFSKATFVLMTSALILSTTIKHGHNKEWSFSDKWHEEKCCGATSWK